MFCWYTYTWSEHLMFEWMTPCPLGNHRLCNIQPVFLTVDWQICSLKRKICLESLSLLFILWNIDCSGLEGLVFWLKKNCENYLWFSNLYRYKQNTWQKKKLLTREHVFKPSYGSWKSTEQQLFVAEKPHQLVWPVQVLCTRHTDCERTKIRRHSWCLVSVPRRKRAETRFQIKRITSN